MSKKKATNGPNEKLIQFADLTIDCEQKKISRDNIHYDLTPKEFQLLYLLLQNANKVTSRREIMIQVWETDYLGDTRTLDVHIRWLREKIEVNPSRPRHLLTVRGVGYQLITHPE